MLFLFWAASKTALLFVGYSQNIQRSLRWSLNFDEFINNFKFRENFHENLSYEIPKCGRFQQQFWSKKGLWNLTNLISLFFRLWFLPVGSWLYPVAFHRPLFSPLFNGRFISFQHPIQLFPQLQIFRILKLVSVRESLVFKLPSGSTIICLFSRFHTHLFKER